MKVAWAFFFLVFATVARAQDSYSWRDGAQTRALYLLPQYVADFRIDKKQRETFRRGNQAKRVLETRGAALFTLSSRSLPVLVDGQSPVFADAPHGPATRALPGGVLVAFHEPKTAKEVTDWARSQGLEVERALAQGIWVLKTEPGLASLQTANRLADVPEVASSQPNWWLNIGPKQARRIPRNRPRRASEDPSENRSLLEVMPQSP